MQVGAANVGNTMMGIALIDMWLEARKRVQPSKESGEGSPLLAAVAKAFDQYIQVQETQNAALIAGAVTYALAPKGGAGVQGVQPVTVEQMAPFLALNVMA